MNKKTHVYFIYDIRDRLCYIGQTSWLQSRMKDHFSNKLISKVEYLTYSNKEDAECVEAYFIDKYNPHLNVRRYPKKVEKGCKIKDTYIGDVREFTCFETDTTSDYAKMAMEYPEFPINQVRSSRGNTYTNTLNIYKVYAESNPEVCMMFYNFKGLVKIVAGKKMRKSEVPLSEIKRIYESLPVKENTVNTYVDGLCSQLPKNCIDNLEDEDIVSFMKSTDTSINFK